MRSPDIPAERWLDLALAPGEDLEPALHTRTDYPLLARDGWRIVSAVLRSGHTRGARTAAVPLVLEPVD